MGRRTTPYFLIALLCCPGQLLAESATEKAIRARQSAYFLMGQQMGYINATLKGDVPLDKAALLVRAQALDVLGRLVFESFPAGSDQGTTQAKPEIWQEPQRFRQLATESQSATAALRTAVEAGDPKAIKTAYAATGRSCKACHDQFKAK